MEEKTVEHELLIEDDYRKTPNNQNNRYFFPLNQETNFKINSLSIENPNTNFIDEDALDFVIKGGGEAGENAQIAKDYYKNTYAPIWNDGRPPSHTNMPVNIIE